MVVDFLGADRATAVAAVVVHRVVIHAQVHAILVPVELVLAADALLAPRLLQLAFGFQTGFNSRFLTR